MTLATGITTGTCATAAATAAAMLLHGQPTPKSVDVELPRGEHLEVQIAVADRIGSAGAWAAVRKYSGDDPDITDGALVKVEVRQAAANDVTFIAGDGVGTITKPGLQIAPGEPAINPVPRAMIRAAVRRWLEGPVEVRISIDGGAVLARDTFNPRLGIVGGLSVLGTTGIVRPFSLPALRCSLVCALDIAAGIGETAPVLVPGNLGSRAAHRHFTLGDDQVIEVSNEWGYMIDALRKHPFEAVLLVGHPGKLTKLAAGHWDTHSSRSPSALPELRLLAAQVLNSESTDDTTTEGFFNAMDMTQRRRVGDHVAACVQQAVHARLDQQLAVGVVLTAMDEAILGLAGEVQRWQRR